MAILGLIAVIAIGGILFVGGGFVVNLANEHRQWRDKATKAAAAVGMTRQMLIEMQVNSAITGTAEAEVNLILHRFNKAVAPLLDED